VRGWAAVQAAPGAVIVFHEHCIAFNRPGVEPGGIVIPHSNVASIEQLPDEDEPPGRRREAEP
jgi:hypothetical protein